MITKIDIKNFGVFKDFTWDSKLSGKEFKKINIIYGRNYSGKTTLSRIIRSLETGSISDKYIDQKFNLKLSGSTITTPDATHGEIIRVFNEDFIRENLKFFSNPDDNIESFAILGEENNRIENEIAEIELDLGINIEGNETGLRLKYINLSKAYNVASVTLDNSKNKLDESLKSKATDKDIGIRNKPEKFGDQNYNITKLKSDIETVLKIGYNPSSTSDIQNFEKLILERSLDPVKAPSQQTLNLLNLSTQAQLLVKQVVGVSGKIAQLVNEAALHRWANDGRSLHKGKIDDCAFCGNKISESRWAALDAHFDEESGKLSQSIIQIIAQIEHEKNNFKLFAKPEKSLFYSKFHKRLDEAGAATDASISIYIDSLESLKNQLKARKDDILNPVEFIAIQDNSKQVKAAIDNFNSVIEESNKYSSSLKGDQDKAKAQLRLNEVYEFLIAIKYNTIINEIKQYQEQKDKLHQKKCIEEELIKQKEFAIMSKRSQLNDEEKGARKVNEYLNHFFGHQSIKLEAKNEVTSDGSKKFKFEVVRNDKKAHHLSEGECSLIAFCYFMAKFSDVNTDGKKPIIWIDDPICSLDSNHIFFVYSLINSQICEKLSYSQLFISTHNLDFLKYLKRIKGIDNEVNPPKEPNKKSRFFVVSRNADGSSLDEMPLYMQNFVSEFNYLFSQIYHCSIIEVIDDSNYNMIYNFGNNARKFIEIYLSYKYPDGISSDNARIRKFFKNDEIVIALIERVSNEYSHFSGVFERGRLPVESPEINRVAKAIIGRIKEVDYEQYKSLLLSISVAVPSEPPPLTISGCRGICCN